MDPKPSIPAAPAECQASTRHPLPVPVCTPPRPMPHHQPSDDFEPGVTAASVHGLRNPLAGLRATLQLAELQATAKTPKINALLNDALREADRLDERICALLTLQQADAAKSMPFHLGRLLQGVEQALESRCSAQGVTLCCEFDPALGWIESAGELLEEVLLELAQNALRASGAGGRLHLAAQVDPDWLEIRVRDSGPGIPAAIGERVFEPFFTTRPDGNGIGLASARQRLGRAGGGIELDSSDEDGCCFRVWLPGRPLTRAQEATP